MAVPDYTYLALGQQPDQIRVLLLNPGKEHEPLSGSLQPISLHSSPVPEYETISYCWGASTKRSLIHLDGKSLNIPISSHEVLARFRHTAAQRALWIDAVCINQADPDERSHQVALMSEVYSKGAGNLVWLGESDETVPVALGAVGEILKEARGETEELGAFSSVVMDPETRLYRYSQTGLGVAFDSAALLGLFARPWFRRLWVVQEVALSQFNSCYCGDYCIAFNDVLRTAVWLRCKMLHLDFDYAKEPGWMTALSTFELADREHGAFSASSASRPGLGHILASARWYDTTDVRDRVYGLFGLLQKVTEQSSEGVRTLLEPDYTKSWIEIFRDAMRAALETKGDLTLLEEVQHRVGELDNAAKELPSWVPLWGRRWEPLLDPFPPGALFRADGGKLDAGHGACPWDPDVIMANGRQISNVASACAVSFGDDSSAVQLATTINECRSELKRADLKCFDQNLAHTLIAGTNSKREASGLIE